MGFRGSDHASPRRLVADVSAAKVLHASSVEHAGRIQNRHMTLKCVAATRRQIGMLVRVFRLVHAGFTRMVSVLRSMVESRRTGRIPLDSGRRHSRSGDPSSLSPNSLSGLVPDSPSL